MYRQLSRTLLVAAVAIGALSLAPADARAVADIQYDTIVCRAVYLEALPPDGAMLPAMPPHGIVLPFRQSGGTPEQLEAAFMVMVVDETGTAVPGQLSYVESPTYIVWRPDAALTVGALYSLQVTLDTQVLDPEGCSFRNDDMLHYGYGVEIVDVPVEPELPVVNLELAHQGYAGDTACCHDAARSCDPADFARTLTLRADAEAPSPLVGWSVREARFFFEGAEADAVTDTANLVSATSLFTATLVDWDGVSDVCITVDLVDAIDGTRTDGSTTCLPADSIGEPEPVEDVLCGPVPSDIGADMAQGDDAAPNANASPGDTDCACAVRTDASAPAPTLWLVAVALFLVGAVLRRRRARLPTLSRLET